jgi:hypothetical protein
MVEVIKSKKYWTERTEHRRALHDVYVYLPS